jgi:hypothetical protein
MVLVWSDFVSDIAEGADTSSSACDNRNLLFGLNLRRSTPASLKSDAEASSLVNQ